MSGGGWRSRGVLLSAAAMGSGLLALSGCETSSEPGAARQPAAWLERVDLTSPGYRDAFDGNVEVLLVLRSRSERTLTVDDLDAGDGVRLRFARGTLRPLHRLSVGVAKPIVIGPRETKRTSLLFQGAGQEAPAALVLWDRKWPLDRVNP